MLFAQTASYALGMDVGLEFGVSNSNFKFIDGGPQIDNEVGFCVGGSAKMDLVIVTVGPEIWYSRNTATINSDYLGSPLTIKSNSLDLPLVASLSLLGPLKVEVGPSFSLINHARVTYDGDKYKMGGIKPDMGYVVGAKVTILGILMVSARYNGHFTDKSVDFIDTQLNMRADTYTFSVGAMF